jgi:NitT/TauT family transport system permease protein
MSVSQTTIDRTLIGVGFLVVWHVASMITGAYWISPPHVTFLRFAKGLFSGEYAFHGYYTLGAALAGFLLGGIPGVALPLLLRRLPLIRRVLDPFLMAGYGVPKLALAPLFILWLGIGIEAKIVLVASVVFFLVFFTTTAGVESVEKRTLQMARVMGANDFQVARHIVWPSAIPFIFAGIRVATPYAIGGVVISELISSNRGLGYLVQLGATNFSTADVLAAIVAITLLTGAASWLVSSVEAHLMRWKGTGASPVNVIAE